MRAAARGDAGRLTHRYILERRTTVPDGLGGRVEAFAPEGAIWGEPRLRRADSTVRADQVDETLEHEIKVRFRAQIEPGWRLRRGSRSFEVVQSFDPDERRRWLVLRTRERSS